MNVNYQSYTQDVPAWLHALFTQNFFLGCSYHENAKKNEKNVCCIDCCLSICPHCISNHRCHRLLQIRRYVYHEVVRLEDLENLIDCSNVQVQYPIPIRLIIYNRSIVMMFVRVTRRIRLTTPKWFSSRRDHKTSSSRGQPITALLVIEPCKNPSYIALQVAR